MSFPRDQCYVCRNPIEDISRGFVASHEFDYKLAFFVENDGLEAVLAREDANFINAVTMQYFLQYPDIFRQQAEIIDVKTLLQNQVIDAGAHKHRLERVAEAHDENNSKFVFLLSHFDCIPFDPAYYVVLNQINTGEKAVDWTIHFSEKVMYNGYAWGKILESLFGRR